MAQGTNEALGILFGVEGGTSGASYKLISETLKKIAEKITLAVNVKAKSLDTSALKDKALSVKLQPVKIEFDKKEFDRQLTELRDAIDKKFKGIVLKVDTKTSGSGSGASRSSGGGSKQKTRFQEIHDVIKGYRGALEKQKVAKGANEQDVLGKKVQKFLDQIPDGIKSLTDFANMTDEQKAALTDLSEEEIKQLQDYKRAADDAAEAARALAEAKKQDADAAKQATQQTREQEKADRAQAKQDEKKAKAKADKDAQWLPQAQGGTGRFAKLESQLPTYQAKISQGVQERYNDLIKHNGEAKKSYEELLAAFDQFQKAINNGDLVGAEKAQTALNAQLKKTNATMGELSAKTDTVLHRIVETIGSKLLQKIAYAVIGLGMRALALVYQNVKKIDDALTQLKIVTRATQTQIDGFTDSVERAAKRIGASVSELIESTTVFARLGYSLQEAEKLAESATTYSKVAAVDINEATKNITATIKAFGIEADAIEDVLDQFVYVGNNYAISSAEIGEAMNNAASALSANGNTLKEAIGIVTAANVTVQNVSKSSTAVRTIAARISRSSGELIELGEDMGSILSTAKLDQQMRAYGVSIVDVNGNLRSTYDILNDLAGVWAKLDNTAQAAIAEMLAGTRQQNSFYSIMQNWSDAQSVANGTEAAGSLEKALEQRVDSIEGRIEQLQATWEGFSRTVLESGAVKVLIQALQLVAEVLEKIVSVLPTTSIMVGALAGLILKYTIKIGSAFLDWGGRIKDAVASAIKLRQEIKKIQPDKKRKEELKSAKEAENARIQNDLGSNFGAYSDLYDQAVAAHKDGSSKDIGEDFLKRLQEKNSALSQGSREDILEQIALYKKNEEEIKALEVTIGELNEKQKNTAESGIRSIQYLVGELKNLNGKLNENIETFNTTTRGEAGLADTVGANKIFDLYKNSGYDHEEFKKLLSAEYGVIDDAKVKTLEDWATKQAQITTEIENTESALKKQQQTWNTLGEIAIGAIAGITSLLSGFAEKTENKAAKIALAIAGAVVAVGAVVVAVILTINKAIAANPIGLILTAISTAIAAFTSLIKVLNETSYSYKNLKTKADKSREAWEEQKTTLEEVEDRLQKIRDRIDEINKQPNLTFVDEKELENLGQEQATLEGEQAAQKELEKQDKEQAVKDSQAAMNAYRNQKKNSAKSNRGWQVVAGLLTPFAVGAWAWELADLGKKTQGEQIDAIIQNYENASDAEKQQVADYMNELDELTKDYEYQFPEFDENGNIVKDLEQWQKDMNSQLDERYDLIEEINAKSGNIQEAWNSVITRQKYKPAIDEIGTFLNNYNMASELTPEVLENLIKQSGDTKGLFARLKELGIWDGSDYEGLKEWLITLRNNIKGVAGITIADDLENVTDKFDVLNKAIEEVGKNGIVALDTVKELMEKYPSLLDEYFVRTQDGYRLRDEHKDKTSYQILEEAAIAEIKEAQEEYERIIREYSDAIDNPDYLDHEAALEALANAQENVNVKMIEWASVLREAKEAEETERLEKEQERLEEQLDVYKELIDIRKDLLESYKEEIDRQKELSRKQKNLADIETQLALAKLDNSAAGKARARELEAQRQEAQDELDDYLLSNAVDDIIDKLDSDYSEYEKFIKSETDRIADEISKLAETLKNILDAILKSQNIDASFSGENSVTEMNELRKRIRENASKGMDISGKDISDFMSAAETGDYKNADKLYQKAKTANEAWEKDNEGLVNGTIPTSSELIYFGNASFGFGDETWNETYPKRALWFDGEGPYWLGTKGVADENLTAAASQEDWFTKGNPVFGYHENLYTVLPGANGEDRKVVKLGETADPDPQDNPSRTYKELLKKAQTVKKFHEGGSVGGIDKNEEFAKLLRGEFVSTPAQMDRFVHHTLPGVVASASKAATINNNSPLVSINCGNITNDAMPQLRDLVSEAVKRINENMENALTRTGFRKAF